MFQQTNKNTRTVFGILLVAIALFVATVAQNIYYAREATAAASTYLNFQGRLKTSTGSVVPDGNYNLEFKIYENITGGSALWTETRTTTNRVRVANGYFSVTLGSVNALTGITNWSDDKFITMNVGGTDTSPDWDGEMTNSGNRMILTAVPYAFQAGNANTANSLTDGTNDFGVGDFIQNGTGLQTNVNFNIQSANSGSIGGIIRAADSQTASLLEFQSSDGDYLTGFNADGSICVGGYSTGGCNTNYVRIANNGITMNNNAGNFGFKLEQQGNNQALFSTGGMNYAGLSIAGTTNSFNTLTLNAGSGQTGKVLEVKDSSNNSVFNIDTTGNVTIGESDNTGTLLVIDTKTGSGDPTGENGAIYYNSNSGKFRCYENGSWVDCIGAAGTLSDSLTDNTADAWDIQEGTNNYININTTNGSRVVS